MLLQHISTLLSPYSVGHLILDDPRASHYNDFFVVGGIRTCLGVSSDPMLLWVSSNSCPLNLLLVRSHQTEVIIVKYLAQGRNNVTRVRVKPRSCDQESFLSPLPYRPRCRPLMQAFKRVLGLTCQ